MKQDIHPKYRPVIFHDVSVDFKVLTRSTATSDEKMEWEDGREYPVIRFDLSSASHAFYTGKEQQLSEKGGRIEAVPPALRGVRGGEGGREEGRRRGLPPGSRPPRPTENRPPKRPGSQPPKPTASRTAGRRGRVMGAGAAGAWAHHPFFRE